MIQMRNLGACLATHKVPVKSPSASCIYRWRYRASETLWFPEILKASPVKLASCHWHGSPLCGTGHIHTTAENRQKARGEVFLSSRKRGGIFEIQFYQVSGSFPYLIELNLNSRQESSAVTRTQANVDLGKKACFERYWGRLNLFLFKIMIF